MYKVHTLLISKHHALDLEVRFAVRVKDLRSALSMATYISTGSLMQLMYRATTLRPTYRIGR